jgi:hypothetical protein
LTFAVSSFSGANSCYSLYLLSTKSGLKNVLLRLIAQKNTFTVESYIFDKKQKKSLSDKATHLGMLGLIKSNIASYAAC